MKSTLIDQCSRSSVYQKGGSKSGHYVFVLHRDGYGDPLGRGGFSNLDDPFPNLYFSRASGFR